MFKTKMQWLLIAVLALTALVHGSARASVEGVVRHGISATQLQNDFIEGYGERGYRAARLTGYRVGSNSTRFMTRWVPDNPATDSKVHFDRTLAQFDALNLAYRNQDFYLIDVSAYNTASGVRYAGIWYKNTNDVTWTAYRDTTYDGMLFLHATLEPQGYKLHRLEAYVINNQSRFISIWYQQPNLAKRWHFKLSYADFQAKLQEHREDGFALTHLDAHTVNGTTWYAGVWRQQGSFPAVRSNRDGMTFQRYFNNYWAEGYSIDNFYVAETANGIRHGGIWFFDGVPNITDDSPLALRLRKAVDSAPALGGAAMLNLTTGEEISIHGDSTFAIASTSKIGILYALMRDADAGDVPLGELINSNTSTGSNGCSYLQPNTNYTALNYARFMIRCSNNWATNVLIARIGRAKINQRLDELGLDVTRLNRYMTGGPSDYGNASASADRAAGIENLSTPREMVKLLRHVLQDNVLNNASEGIFWATLKMDSDNGVVNGKNYIAAQVASMGFNPRIEVFNKPGGLTGADARNVRADAGRFSFPDGTEVLLAVFMDFISDNPDQELDAAAATVTQAEQAIKNVAKEIAQQYYQP